jgi:hypothetical protein
MPNIKPLAWPDLPAPFPDWLWANTIRLGMVVTGAAAIGFLWLSWFWALAALICGVAVWGLGFWLEYRWARANLEVIDAELAARDPASSKRAWPDPRQSALLTMLCDDCVDWKTRAFVPDDPCWLVLHPHSYQDGPASERLRVLIDRQLKVEISPNEANELVMRSVGQVVEYLLNLQQDEYRCLAQQTT